MLAIERDARREQERAQLQIRRMLSKTRVGIYYYNECNLLSNLNFDIFSLKFLIVLDYLMFQLNFHFLIGLY